MNTSNGNMCGSEWDEYCHRLLSLKYSNYYQRVPSKFGGDLGIEGLFNIRVLSFNATVQMESQQVQNCI